MKCLSRLSAQAFPGFFIVERAELALDAEGTSTGEIGAGQSATASSASAFANTF
jgi:hypothetical protein